MITGCSHHSPKSPPLDDRELTTAISDYEKGFTELVYNTSLEEIAEVSNFFMTYYDAHLNDDSWFDTPLCDITFDQAFEWMPQMQRLFDEKNKFLLKNWDKNKNLILKQSQDCSQNCTCSAFSRLFNSALEQDKAPEIETSYLKTDQHATELNYSKRVSCVRENLEKICESNVVMFLKSQNK